MNCEHQPPLDFEDLCHWYARSGSLLGRPIAIIQIPAPIIFNRNDWTGLTGTIRPTGENTFTIDDIDGEWTMKKRNSVYEAKDEHGRAFYGDRFQGVFYFLTMGIERSSTEDPRIAFARLMHNL